MADPARELHIERRQRVLARVLRTDATLRRIYERAASRIRRRLRATGFTDAEVAVILREEFAAVEAELLPEVEADIRAAAEAGNDAAVRTLRILDLLEQPPPFLRRLRSPLRILPGSGSGGGSRGTG